MATEQPPVPDNWREEMDELLYQRDRPEGLT